MTIEEIKSEAQKIAEDILEEQGDLAPQSIDLEEARETVSCYGYEGEELESISKELVSVWEGIF